MDDFATRMRAAADSPPPARIDLDALISSELTRRRNLRWAGGAAAVAAAVTLAIAGPAMLPRGPAGDNPAGVRIGGPGSTVAARPCPTAAAPGPQQSHGGPRPSEPCAEAVERLAAELMAALRLHLVRPAAPDGVSIDSAGFVYVPVRLRYEATANVSGPNGHGYLQIQLIASHEHPDPGRANCPSDSCRYEKDPDGTIVVAKGDAQQQQVEIYRPDGTALRALGYPASNDAPSPFTLDQVIAIARTPGLTLYP